MSFKEVKIQNPWFDFIASGKKTIEGRLNRPPFSEFKIGDKLKFINNGNAVCAVVLDIKKYKTFEEYLSIEGLGRTLPNTKTIADGINVYRKYYSKEKEEEFGICAIHLKKTKCMPKQKPQSMFPSRSQVTKKWSLKY
jgi:ASC-1-like (ASCH) protein